MLRTHRCGDLRSDHIGERVTLCGWVHTRRDHGGVTFIDLRDAAGLVQAVFNPEVSNKAHETAQELRSEFCITVTGDVVARKEGTVNLKLGTGEVEVSVESVEIFSRSETPPFPIDEQRADASGVGGRKERADASGVGGRKERADVGGARASVDEMLRLKYRYLDLRKERMLQNLQMRHRIISAIRRFFDAEGFTEVETPMLTRATPEGARDYLVPARLHPGSFYALPQSPQLFKQLLMVSGLDRYYQIVRCFRDEDLRADRQPDFTQLDLEMSFVEVEDVLDITERMFKQVWREVLDVELDDFARIPYRESMERFGTDKPDLRFGMELKDLGDVFASTEVKVFRSVLDGNGLVKALVAEGRAGMARKELDALVDEAKALGAGGLVWIG
ncbi:MAG: amino acid--tRNA ligase-related protein, partial [Actinomycetota bacterium]